MNGGVTHGDESWPERVAYRESSQLGHHDVMRDEVNVLFGEGTTQWVGLFADGCVHETL